MFQVGFGFLPIVEKNKVIRWSLAIILPLCDFALFVGGWAEKKGKSSHYI